MKGRNVIHIKFGMAVTVPRRLSPRNRATVERFIKAFEALNGVAAGPGFGGDIHHLADLTGIVEQLVQVSRRARATSGGT